MERVKVMLTVGIVALSLVGGAVDPPERARIRTMMADPATFERAVAEGVKSSDPVVRRWTLCQLWKRDKARAVELGKTLAEDPDEYVREFLVTIGAIEVKNDFTFYRDNVARSESPNDDHDYAPAGSVPIPTEGWKLAFDPKNVGHKEMLPWFDPRFDDSKWGEANVTDVWERQGFPDYDGIAWYRVKFTAPLKPADGKLFELCFGGVDEEAWVWLNGQYVGQHTEGEAGYAKKFRFDIESEIKWGAENVLAVRVSDTRFGGGIWRPVTLEVLK